MIKKVKRIRTRKEPHKTRALYLGNEDHPKMEPIPERSKWIATVVVFVIVMALAWFLCSCANDFEMPYGLPLSENNPHHIAKVKKYHEAIHVPSAADGP